MESSKNVRANHRIYSSNDQARYQNEPAKASNRSDFERDRARILHSSAFRRLGAKTQVYSPDQDDFIRTRLTHSLEVSQIGRHIGGSLGTDPDIVDAACLAHDIGHPPFGHNGEYELNLIAQDIGGFEGNAQTFRILTRLETKVFADNQSIGLNLTRATLDASLKYPFQKGFNPPSISANKFGVYDDDLPIYIWTKQNAPKDKSGRFLRPIEADIMDFADDVSYCVHDIEDGIVSKSMRFSAFSNTPYLENLISNYVSKHPGVSESELLAAYFRLKKRGFFEFEFEGTRESYAKLKTHTSKAIGHFCNTVQSITREKFGDKPLIRYNAELIIPPEIEAEIEFYKAAASEILMNPRNEGENNRLERQIIRDLVEILMQKSPEPSPLLAPIFVGDWENAKTESQRLRVVIDQVASLTNWGAKEMLNRLIN